MEAKRFLMGFVPFPDGWKPRGLFDVPPGECVPKCSDGTPMTLWDTMGCISCSNEKTVRLQIQDDGTSNDARGWLALRRTMREDAEPLEWAVLAEYVVDGVSRPVDVSQELESDPEARQEWAERRRQKIDDVLLHAGRDFGFIALGATEAELIELREGLTKIITRLQ